MPCFCENTVLFRETYEPETPVTKLSQPKTLDKIGPKQKMKEPKQQKLSFRVRSAVQLEGKLKEYDRLSMMQT